MSNIHMDSNCDTVEGSLLLYPNRAIKEIMDNLSSRALQRGTHPSSTQGVTNGMESLKEETATIA
jgi:hypothetical protein